MLIKPEKRCTEIIANDGCRLRELLHPDRDDADISYSLAIAYVDPGKSTYHHHLKQSEVYYILEGTGLMHIGEENRDVEKGDTVYIPKEDVQWIENTGTNILIFAAIVSPPWRTEDDIRIEE